MKNRRMSPEQIREVFQKAKKDTPVAFGLQTPEGYKEWWGLILNKTYGDDSVTVSGVEIKGHKPIRFHKEKGWIYGDAFSILWVKQI